MANEKLVVVSYNNGRMAFRGIFDLKKDVLAEFKKAGVLHNKKEKRYYVPGPEKFMDTTYHIHKVKPGELIYI